MDSRIKKTKEGFYVLRDDTHISRWVEKAGRLDCCGQALPEILKYINKGDFVIDVGAFIGDHTTAYLNKVGKDGLVWAFEPNPDAFTCLNLNCQGAVCHSFGLGVGEHSDVIHRDKNAGASVIGSGKHHITIAELDKLNIPRRPSLIKIDVEGMAYAVIEGAAFVIEDHSPIIVAELEGTEDAALVLNELRNIAPYSYEVLCDSMDATKQHDAIFKPL